MNAQTVTNWELGRTPPDLPFIPKIIQFLGYTPWDGKARAPGERLKALRWSLGMTQETMARRLGMDPTTLARWERGEKGPTVKKFRWCVETIFLLTGVPLTDGGAPGA